MTSSTQGTSGGRKRHKPNKTSSQSSSERPGDPGDPASFVNFFEKENRTAAYLGFSNTSDLRRLAVSFPVLEAYIKFEPISVNARVHSSLCLLNDGVEKYTNVGKPDEEWPIIPNDRNAAHNKACRIAAILVDLRDDLNGLCDASLTDTHQALQDAAHKDFSKAYPSVPVANLQHGPALLSEGQLGPLQSESAIEPFNRCFGLLKYFQHQLRAVKNQKNLRDEHGLNKGSPVKIDAVPSWMRPKAPGAETIPTNPAVSVADKLSRKSFVALWQKKFDDDELEAALAEEEFQNVDLPDSRQTLSTDPRVFGTSMAFRDQLRRQFRCAQLKTNIYKCRLEYKAEDDTQTADVLQADWNHIKELLNDDKHTECIFKLGFAPLADGEEFSYETDEHPNMAGFFVPQADADGTQDMVLDEVALQQRGAALSQQAGSPTEGLAQNANQEALMRFVDMSMTPGKGPHDIGSAPNPSLRFAGDKDSLLNYFDGKDIDNPEELRMWQQTVLDDISNAVPSISKNDQPKRGLLSKDAEKSLHDAAFFGAIAAEARERKDEGEIQASASDAQSRQREVEENERYYTLRSTYSGTQAQAGPHLDLCLQVLACEKQADGLYKSRVLEGATTSSFYHYQISGAIGCVLKLYGKIDVEKLLSATPTPYSFDVEKVKAAAEVLQDLMVHGCLLCDDVGFGKTKQGLLVAYINQLLSHDANPDHPEEVLHRPGLLVVPSSLVHPWLVEIRENWKCFDLVVSFDDHNFKKQLGHRTLTRSDMANFPDSIPDHLKWVFNPRDKAARRALVVTSFETHKARTATRHMSVEKEGEHHTPRAKLPNGRWDYKVKPKYRITWKTKFSGVFGFLLADEAQKVKNYNSGVSAALYSQNIPKMVLMTATPFHNHVRDLLGLTHLLSTMAVKQLKYFVSQDPSIASKMQDIQASDNPFPLLDALEPTDPLRLYSINAKLLLPVVNTDQDSIHKVVMRLKPVLEVVMIRRSASSELPVTTGEPIKLREMFKKIVRKTVSVSRTAEDELEYQIWHRRAANEFTEQLKGRKTEVAPPPGQPTPVVAPAPFAMPMGPLRKLSLSNFSTKMARLDATMEMLQGNTHVATLQKWREAGKEAEFLVELTRGAGEKKPETAADMAKCLSKGSPTMSLVCREVLAARLIDPLDPQKHKQHQKLLIGEATPVNAYWIMSTLRALCIDARILHAGLSNKAKADMVDLFNQPGSSLKVLIMMYDVGAYGLNLHEACNRILITSIARSFALEEQLCGRTNRITSIFNTIVTRRFIPNSHDIFRSSAQADKATVQLATNAQDPKIRELLLEQLQKLQVEVDECHASPAGQALKKEVLEHASRRAARDANLAPIEEVLPDRRSSLRPRAGNRQTFYDDVCSRCDEAVSSIEAYLCDECSEPGHAYCVGLDEGTSRETTFVCKTCVLNDVLGEVDEGLLTKDGAMIFADPEDVDAYVDHDGEGEETSGEHGRTYQQQRIEDQIFDDDFDLILGDSDMAQFASDCQPDDDDRRRLVLLSLDTKKVWQDSDLNREKFLRIGLLLLFNMIQGKNDLATSRSIHIHYDQFSKQTRQKVEKDMKVTKKMERDMFKRVNG